MDKEKDIYDNSIVKMFGLSYNQASLMFSAQLRLAKYDCELEQNKKTAGLKARWISRWERSIVENLNKIDSTRNAILYPDDILKEAFINELKASDNKTWYYIVVLELFSFAAYTPLGEKEDKQYWKCKYDEKKTAVFLKEFILRQGYLSTAEIDRLNKTYNKSLSQISGKAGKVMAKVLAVIAISGISAALCAVGAGGIAVALVGSAFPGLHGAALVAACLAFLGGGAIAVGGAGMAGGVAIIAGGGALLGLAGGGAAVGIGSKILYSSPEFTLTQAAKLETILKEVVLNTQQDIVTAQKIMERYRQQIIDLNTNLGEEKLKNEKNKKELDRIKLSLKYLEKSYKNMTVYASAFEVGTQADAAYGREK